MSDLRGIGASRWNSTGAAEEPGLVFREERRAVRASCLAAGTLACPRCDAPVAPGEGRVAVCARLACPYCAHSGPLREFLSLAAPTRPAHVLVRVAWPDELVRRPS